MPPLTSRQSNSIGDHKHVAAQILDADTAEEAIGDGASLSPNVTVTDGQVDIAADDGGAGATGKDAHVSAGDGGDGGGLVTVVGGSGTDSGASGGNASLGGGEANSAGGGTGGQASLQGGTGGASGTGGAAVVTGGSVAGGPGVVGAIFHGGTASLPGGLELTNLPTSDPEIVGYLWNDSGTLKISAGEV